MKQDQQQYLSNFIQYFQLLQYMSDKVLRIEQSFQIFVKPPFVFRKQTILKQQSNIFKEVARAAFERKKAE